MLRRRKVKERLDLHTGEINPLAGWTISRGRYRDSGTAAFLCQSTSAKIFGYSGGRIDWPSFTVAGPFRDELAYW